MCSGGRNLQKTVGTSQHSQENISRETITGSDTNPGRLLDKNAEYKGMGRSAFTKVKKYVIGGPHRRRMPRIACSIKMIRFSLTLTYFIPK